MTEVHAPPDPGATFDRLVALCEPARRDLYFFVARHGGWVSRGEAADALGVRYGLVAHHLDRLAADGLLEVEYRRLTGRSGPGAGRPSKLYRRAGEHFEVTIPPRNPALIAQLLADGMARAGDRAAPVRRLAIAAARRSGQAAGGRAQRSDGDRRRAFVALLADHGYAPRVAGGELALANCPYEPLADQDRDLVCGLNLALIEGFAVGIGLQRARCVLSDRAGGCCVRVRPWPGNGRV